MSTALALPWVLDLSLSGRLIGPHIWAYQFPCVFPPNPSLSSWTYHSSHCPGRKCQSLSTLTFHGQPILLNLSKLSLQTFPLLSSLHCHSCFRFSSSSVQFIELTTSSDFSSNSFSILSQWSFKKIPFSCFKESRNHLSLPRKLKAFKTLKPPS